MNIHFQTAAWAPPSRVSLRAGKRVPTKEYVGFFRDTWWTFYVPDDLTVFLLVVDGMSVSEPFDARADHLIREWQVNFTAPDLLTEQSSLQRAWFPVGADDADWDVIVIGTGMGGGTLLYELSRRAPRSRVLGIEAGTMLLPTHAANLPRRVWAASNEQVATMWGLYSQLGRRPFKAPQQWTGHEIFALGGRTLLWGGLSPRLSAADEVDWPPGVVHDLRTRWYYAAEQLLNVRHPHSSTLQQFVTEQLDSVSSLRDHVKLAAPMAVERERSDSWRIPSGMFSTADLLLSARLAVPPGGDVAAEDWEPYIHLSEIATKVTRESDGAWKLNTTTVADGQAHTYRAKTLVLAAGTVETARLALASNLDNPLIGVGLTEHDMWWAHFEVPADTVPDPRQNSVKILAVPRVADGADDWNLLVEVNVDLNEERLPAMALRAPYLASDDGYVPGQLVFLCRGQLKDGQKVIRRPGRWPRFNQPNNHTLPAIATSLEPDANDERDDLQAVCNDICTALGAKAIGDVGPPQLQRAGRTFVAHEVGTMRMPRPLPPGGQPMAPSVVDANLQVEGHEGLYVCDNSVFPACPSANPSLTLAALALRLAEHLASSLMPAGQEPIQT